jgi:hypothetical protein
MRVYVAGKYSDDNIIGCLNNIHDGIKASVEVLKLGHSPFCPFLDYQFQLFDKTLTVEDYYKYSMAWLEVSDCVLVLPNSENSKGTQAEIERAIELGIPVVYEIGKVRSK